MSLLSSYRTTPTIKTLNPLRSINAHQIRNITSARVSVPSLVIPTPEPRARGMRAFVWRTPLRTTGPYWEGVLLSLRLPRNIKRLCIHEGWFRGLSAAFLAARTARLLVLAGTDRLDRELMIGQMQGKFQLVVVPNTGHMLHEVRPWYKLKFADRLRYGALCQGRSSDTRTGTCRILAKE